MEYRKCHVPWICKAVNKDAWIHFYCHCSHLGGKCSFFLTHDPVLFCFLLSLLYRLSQKRSLKVFSSIWVNLIALWLEWPLVWSFFFSSYLYLYRWSSRERRWLFILGNHHLEWEIHEWEAASYSTDVRNAL